MAKLMSPAEVIGAVSALFGIGVVLLSIALWVLRAIIAKEVTPALTTVANEAKALAVALRETKEVAAEERAETHRILQDLTKIVTNIEGRVIRLEAHALTPPLPGR